VLRRLKSIEQLKSENVDTILNNLSIQQLSELGKVIDVEPITYYVSFESSRNLYWEEIYFENS